MKQIIYHKQFKKHYKKRIQPFKDLDHALEARLKLFTAGIRDYPLNDHALKGSMNNKRAFSITPDYRVVYEETTDAYIFYDIGTHAQVYK